MASPPYKSKRTPMDICNILFETVTHISLHVSSLRRRVLPPSNSPPARGKWRITNRTILTTSTILILFRRRCHSSPTNLGRLTLSLSLACLATLRLARSTIFSGAVSDSSLVSSSTPDAATRFVICPVSYQTGGIVDFHFWTCCRSSKRRSSSFSFFLFLCMSMSGSCICNILKPSIRYGCNE